MNTKVLILSGVLALGLILASQSFFVVDQTEQAIVLQLGQPVGEARQPGLHLKVPFIQTVRTFDKRVLSVDPRAGQFVISSGQTNMRKPAKVEKPETPPTDSAEDGPNLEDMSGEPIIVDTFARYRITDPLRFMKTLVTIQGANSTLEQRLNAATKAVLGKTTLTELLSVRRAAVMESILTRVNADIKRSNFGVEIIDVRIVRADLTDELRSSTVRQMNSSLKELATERRAEGEEKALEIRSTAEKERTVILAEANRDSQMIRGQGDKDAIKIYADAFNVDPEFYSFLRSMEAYKTTMANPETRLILSPDSPFFKYFGQ